MSGVLLVSLIFSAIIYYKKANATDINEHSYGYRIGEKAYGQSPNIIAAAPDGSIYVYDLSLYQIVHFSSDDSVISRFNVNDGSGNQYIYAMTVGLDGTLYASNNSRIFSLTPDGQIISSFYTTSGNIRNIAVSDDGSIIYVIQGNRIVSYNMSGVQINSWGTTSSSASDGLFNSPQGLNIYNNEIYVADLGNNRVQVFDLNGNFLRKWSSTSARSVKLIVTEILLLVE